MKRIFKFNALFLSIVLFVLSFSNVCASPILENAKRANINVSATTNKINVGTNFVTYVKLDSVQEAVYSHVYSAKSSIYAEDIKIGYDSDYFEFVEAEPMHYGFEIFHQDTSQRGQLRFIVASKGEHYGISKDIQILQLTFKAKNTAGKGKIATTYGLIANGSGIEFETTCGGTEIEVINTDTTDVNRDGKYTLGDLAIDARHYNMNSYRWDPRFQVDVVKDNQVNDFDLKAVVQSILSKEK